MQQLLQAGYTCVFSAASTFCASCILFSSLSQHLPLYSPVLIILGLTKARKNVHTGLANHISLASFLVISHSFVFSPSPSRSHPLAPLSCNLQSLMNLSLSPLCRFLAVSISLFRSLLLPESLLLAVSISRFRSLLPESLLPFPPMFSSCLSLFLP